MMQHVQNRTHRGVDFVVGVDRPSPGWRWEIPQMDHLGRNIAPICSGGAFYDGCDDHPEGGCVWAEAACRRFIDRMFDVIIAPVDGVGDRGSK